jgi:type II secretory pathway pseudopilin PulG
VNCAETRGRLPEQALGSIRGREARDVDRHLTWCAACRKEFDELARAASLLPYALEPASPPEDLEDRVVERVQRLARSRHHGARRGRSVAVAAVAAAIAVASLGWGMAMAHRAESAKAAAAQAVQRQQDVMNQFIKVLNRPALFTDPRNRLSIGTLIPSAKAGGGEAITLTSPTRVDFAFVSVTKLPTPAPSSLPYTVVLSDGQDNEFVVDKIPKLDGDGGFQAFREFPMDLSSYTKVIVRDANGRTLLQGSVASSDITRTPGS